MQPWLAPLLFKELSTMLGQSTCLSAPTFSHSIAEILWHLMPRDIVLIHIGWSSKTYEPTPLVTPSGSPSRRSNHLDHRSERS